MFAIRGLGIVVYCLFVVGGCFRWLRGVGLFSFYCLLMLLVGFGLSVSFNLMFISKLCLS